MQLTPSKSGYMKVRKELRTGRGCTTGDELLASLEQLTVFPEDTRMELRNRPQKDLHLGSSIATRARTEEDGYPRRNGREPDSWLLCSEGLVLPLQQGFAALPHIAPEIRDRDHGEIRWILERGYEGFAQMGRSDSFACYQTGRRSQRLRTCKR